MFPHHHTPPWRKKRLQGLLTKGKHGYPCEAHCSPRRQRHPQNPQYQQDKTLAAVNGVPSPSTGTDTNKVHKSSAEIELLLGGR